MSYERRISLFRNGRSQAVRIPKEFELPGKEATIRREGDRLVITPANEGSVPSLGAWLAKLEPLAVEDRMPEIEDYPAEPINL